MDFCLKIEAAKDQYMKKGLRPPSGNNAA